MGLSNENPNPHTSTLDEYRGQLAQMQARRLTAQLIKGERNDSPPDPREATNPAHGVHIRRIDLEKSLAASRVTVTQECADHNSSAEDLGHPGWAELWKRSR